MPPPDGAEHATTWSRVEEGFYVASRDGDFLGFVDRQDESRFLVFDGHGEPLGEGTDLGGAMDLLRHAPAPRPDGPPDADALVTVVYTSLATTRFDDERLEALLTASRAANAERGVTGLLLYREGRFLQVLEGPAAAVHDLVTVIAADRRHHEVRVLVDDPLATRRFADWSMGYRPWTTPTERLPAGFRESFDDLDASPAPSDALRAVGELLLWFRYRVDPADEY